MLGNLNFKFQLDDNKRSFINRKHPSQSYMLEEELLGNRRPIAAQPQPKQQSMVIQKQSIINPTEIQKNLLKKLYQEQKAKQMNRQVEKQDVKNFQAQQILNQIIEAQKQQEQRLSYKSYSNNDVIQKDWRSITPERIENIIFENNKKREMMVTEPNDTFKMVKSLSQEQNAKLPKQQSLQPKIAFQQQSTSSSNVFTSSKHRQQMSSQRTRLTASSLSLLGQQINSILNARQKKAQIHRPQSELLHMYDMGKNIKQQSSNDISSNLINSSANIKSVNSTNLHIRRKQNALESFTRGTETERSYLHMQSNKWTPDKLIKNYEMRHFHKSVNDEFDHQPIEVEKKQAYSSESKSAHYKEYLQRIQNIHSDAIGRVHSYYTQNQQSQSQSSFRNQEEKLVEKENSKSENTTTRNKVARNDKTPLKNFQSPRVQSHISSSKVNSLLSSMNKCQEKSFQKPNPGPTLDSKPHLIVEDPNHTHLLLGTRNYSVWMYNLYSHKTHQIGKHNRPVTSISNVILDKQRKMFYTSSRDGVIKQWSSESMHGNYKQTHQFRINLTPLQLLQDNDYLFIFTTNQIMIKSNTSLQIEERIKFDGNFKVAIYSQNNEIIFISDNQLLKLTNGKIIPQCSSYGNATAMKYLDNTLYVKAGDVQVFDDIPVNYGEKRLRPSSRINVDVDQLFVIYEF